LFVNVEERQREAPQNSADPGERKRCCEAFAGCGKRSFGTVLRGRDWEEVGTWWQALASQQAAVTPVLAQKAKELTSGLTSDAAKEKAIYEYVALKFRYISISLGAGKYRPHTAAEVLSNEYGDCKDKHTLFTALLNAAGIEAWPALIGAGVKFDPAAPSPAQFNHVITVIPQGGKYVWLDTTADVAPFGLLNQLIRDEQVLVIPSAGKAALVKTPIDPPFTSSSRMEVNGSLAADGTLTGHFDFELTGDTALSFRAGFRQLAPTQWQTVVQQISYTLNHAGDVSAVSVDDLEHIDKPLHLGYDYTRKDFSDWKEHKISMPLPPVGFGPGNEAEKPKESFWSGAPGILFVARSFKCRGASLSRCLRMQRSPASSPTTRQAIRSRTACSSPSAR
jgi:hypothetical protein